MYTRVQNNGENIGILFHVATK